MLVGSETLVGMDHGMGDRRGKSDEENLKERGDSEAEYRDGGMEEEEEEAVDDEASMNLIKTMTEKLVNETVQVRVHDIVIIGNSKTKGSVIEAYLTDLRDVSTMQDLLQKSAHANSRLRALGIFDSCVITLDAGPEELPGTVMVFFCLFPLNTVILDWIVKLDIFVFQC